MKKAGIILIFMTLFGSCNQDITKKDIQKINGYWQIEKVIFSNGEEKAYSINEDYDYFKIDNKNSGFRKKVKPQLDGTFLTNNTFEKVSIITQNDKVILQYKTAFATWRETLIAISDEKMIAIGKNNLTYHYKRVTSINVLKKL
jgi:hypothetical protein